MTTPPPLEYGQCYHIYNRGNNGETLFRNERNYHYFLALYAKHISPITDTFAYCLNPNHFHFAVQIKTEAEIQKIAKNRKLSTPSHNFGNLFNAYAKSINNAYGRTGSLFKKPFHRKVITDDAYFWRLVMYIHYNPQKHRLIDDFRLWPFSSYSTFLDNQPTRLKRETVLATFGNRERFIKDHNEYKAEKMNGEFE